MAKKLQCRQCGTVFDGGTESKLAVCPKCGKQYKNPNYVEPTNVAEPARSRSEFTGGLLGLIVHKLVATLVSIVTVGLLLPWAVCYLQRWETEHTVVDGYKLAFDGKAISLFGNWVKWFLLTLITCGIYSFWVTIKMKKWVASHTHLTRVRA